LSYVDIIFVKKYLTGFFRPVALRKKQARNARNAGLTAHGEGFRVLDMNMSQKQCSLTASRPFRREGMLWLKKQFIISLTDETLPQSRPAAINDTSF
jgi:hypothetical protein